MIRLPPVEQTLRLEGRTIGFETGRGGFQSERPTMVLIHGAGGSTQAWRGQIGPLGRKMNVLALDLPGHGRSDGPALDNLPAAAAWVIEVLEAMAWPGRPLNA
ncbi:MAG: alpha/beta fold hydrolase [Thermodesulfobacteriota bacterium]